MMLQCVCLCSLNRHEEKDYGLSSAFVLRSAETRAGTLGQRSGTTLMLQGWFSAVRCQVKAESLRSHS